MGKKVGTLIKEARTAKGYTQEQLAKKVKGLSASDIGKAERGEKDLTQEQLKTIAKATGVTQKSLLDAAKGKTAAKKTSTTTSAAKKTTTSTAKKTTTSTAKKTSTAKTSSAKKTTSSSSAKKTSSSSTSMKLTAAEKKLVELYRAADADTKKEAVDVLKGEKNSSLLGNILGGKNGITDSLTDIIGKVLK